MNDNDERVMRATACVMSYEAAGPSDTDEEAVTDLLTDLMHFCASEKIDFARKLALAQDNFKDEAQS